MSGELAVRFILELIYMRMLEQIKEEQVSMCYLRVKNSIVRSTSDDSIGSLGLCWGI